MLVARIRISAKQVSRLPGKIKSRARDSGCSHSGRPCATRNRITSLLFDLGRREMRLLLLCVLPLLLMPALEATAQPAVAPTGTLRAAYLSSNPAQAVKDSQTGMIRGTAVDLTRELGRRLGVEVTLTGVQSPQNVIDAVRNGQADIGFVAYNPERA